MKLVLMSAVFLLVVSCSHFRGSCHKHQHNGDNQGQTVEKTPCEHHKHNCDKKDCQEGKCPYKKGDGTICEKCQKGDCDRCKDHKCEKCKDGKCPLKKDGETPATENKKTSSCLKCVGTMV